MNPPTCPDHSIEMEPTTILGESGEQWQGTFYACPRPECLQRFNVEREEYFRTIGEQDLGSSKSLGK